MKEFFDEIDPKYKKLVEMYSLAYLRASQGKGHERHSKGEPYDQQWILRGTRLFGIGGPQFQIGKKNEEIEKIEGYKAKATEFLDIMNYAAAAAIALLEKEGYEFSSDIPEE